MDVDNSLGGSLGGTTVHTAAGRSVRLPTSRSQFRSLIAYLDGVITMQGCDNTLHLSEGWARAHGVAWGRLFRSLRGLGAFCDCEVAINVAESEFSDREPGG